MIAGIANIPGISKVYAGADLVWSAAPPAPVYTPLFAENFPNAGTADASLSTVNWTVAAGVTCVENSTSNWVSFQTGAGETTPLNAGYSTVTDKGLIYRGSSSITLFWTPKYTVSRSLYNRLVFKAYVGHALPFYNNFAIRVNGNWYASNISMQASGTVASAAEFATEAQLFEADINLLTAKWYPMVYSPGVQLSADFGTLVDLPAGYDITAFGLLIQNGGGTGTGRIDGYTITAVT